MRKRSKSLFAEVDCGQSVVADFWTPSDNIKLLRAVYKQLPQNDSIPYDQRIAMIDWKEISIENKSHMEVKKQFNILISKIRNYRVLSEMLIDLQKAIWKEMPLPKKRSAFSLFMEERKDEFKNKAGEIGRKGAFLALAAQHYKELSQEEKENLVWRAKLLKERYNECVTSYGVEKKMKNLKGDLKEQHKPSPLLNFWKSETQKDAKFTFTSAKKLYSELDKKHKLNYILQYLGVKEGEKLNMQQYDAAFKTLSKDEFSIIEDYEGRPKKLSAYNYFMKDYFGRNDTSDMKNRSLFFTKMGEVWKNLSDDERAKYEDMAERAQENYAEQYNAYIKSLPLDRQSFEMNKIFMKDMTKRFKKKQKNGGIHLKKEPQDEEFIKKDSQNEECIKTNSQNNDEILALFSINTPQSKTFKKSDSYYKSKLESPTFSQVSTSSPKEKYNTHKIKVEKKEEELETEGNKNSRKLNDVLEEDNDHQIPSTSLLLKAFPEKFPSSAWKYFAKMIYTGTRKNAKRAFKRLSNARKEEIIKIFEKAKKKYLEIVEGKLISPTVKRLKHSSSQSDISSEEFSDFNSS